MEENKADKSARASIDLRQDIHLGDRQARASAGPVPISGKSKKATDQTVAPPTVNQISARISVSSLSKEKAANDNKKLDPSSVISNQAPVNAKPESAATT